MKRLVSLSQGLIEKGMLPDFVIRFGMRQLLKETLQEKYIVDPAHRQYDLNELIQQMRESPIAVNTKDANEQHYEVPTEFFKHCLGKNMKYSSCYYSHDVPLDVAEDDMLEFTCDNADLKDGQQILEFGCGWGSLSLYMASHFPKAQITSVSNSKTQKIYIDEQAQLRGLTNIKVITADMNTFDIQDKFDRIVSVEMFEHMRNWAKLMERAAGFLKPGGKLFIHIFTHKDLAYFFNEKDESDFIGRYFFTGGIMPSDSLPLYFQDHFAIEQHLRYSGEHYSRTAEDWLTNMDANKAKILPILKATYGEKDYVKWWHYWRIFYMACAELWGYKGGTEWMVSHYRFSKK